ncbi:MAG: acyl-CoA thioesterase [Bacteroidetes bacterium]|nr:acyl-CoA thioesterase [Bacteroidota bacterium]
MISHDLQLRVLYGHTDQMGVVYYGRYFEYFEAGRNELLRAIGLPYYRMEDQGLMLPVVESHADYRGSFRYDDLFTIRTIIRTMPTVKIRLDYELFLPGGPVQVTGFTQHVFVDRDTRKPRRVPDTILKAFSPYFT